ncbi:MAG: RDD family protein [Oligoflexia bacterium]|nr:RDD family protein [Oligoflexia bacterium]
MLDEFEFKPLTEGLGFHKKAMELKEDALTKMPTQTGILPKSKPLVTPNMPPKAVVWNQQTAKLNFREAMLETPKAQYENISFSWSAAVFDAAMILGMTLLFSAVVFALTMIELTTIYDALITDVGIQVAAVLIVFAVFEIYTVGSRTFFGKTLGEWVFDIRLGQPEQQLRFSYPFRVALRSFLVTITGFVLMPVLSSAFGKDIAGILTGAKLMCEKR